MLLLVVILYSINANLFLFWDRAKLSSAKQNLIFGTEGKMIGARGEYTLTDLKLGRLKS